MFYHYRLGATRDDFRDSHLAGSDSSIPLIRFFKTLLDSTAVEVVVELQKISPYKINAIHYMGSLIFILYLRSFVSSISQILFLFGLIC